MRTLELTGAALDWAVAKCEGVTPIAVKKKYSKGHTLYRIPAATIPLEYSTNWAQGGPIIEREGIVVDSRKEYGWIAAREFWYLEDKADHALCSKGETYLIAAMRCYVESILGDEVEIPKELAA
jgi:hypothetical protein